MGSVVSRVDGCLSRVERAVLCVLVPAVVTITFLQVIYRYVLNRPLTWSEELAIYLFIWISFLGASVGMAARGHYGLEMLTRGLPRGIRAVLTGVVYVVSFMFLGAVTILGAQMVLETRHVSTTLQISMRWFYSAIPIGSFFMLVHLTAQACGGAAAAISAETA